MTSPYRLRVCHVVSGDNWGGAETMILNLVSAQARRGELDPVLIVLNEGQFAARARSIGICVRLVAEQRKPIWTLARAVEREIRGLMPHVLHTHRYKENLLNFLIAVRRGYRSVVTIHGYEPARRAVERCTIAVRDAVTFRLGRTIGARFVAVTDDLRKLYGLSTERCEIIPNGIPVRVESPPGRSESRPAGESVPVIGWVGRMVPIKGVATLLDAVAQMPIGPRRPDLLLVGDGPERSALERRARSLGIQDRTRFVGFVEDAHELFSQMDVFALPSLHEGVPLALLEALEAGVPVVAAAVGGIPAILGDTGAGCLVESRSPAVWAAAIGDLLSDDAKARMMAERGRRLIRESFSAERMVGEYVRVYQGTTV